MLKQAASRGLEDPQSRDGQEAAATPSRLRARSMGEFKGQRPPARSQVPRLAHCSRRKESRGRRPCPILRRPVAHPSPDPPMRPHRAVPGSSSQATARQQQGGPASSPTSHRNRLLCGSPLLTPGPGPSTRRPAARRAAESASGARAGTAEPGGRPRTRARGRGRARRHPDAPGGARGGRDRARGAAGGRAGAERRRRLEAAARSPLAAAAAAAPASAAVRPSPPPPGPQPPGPT